MAKTKLKAPAEKPGKKAPAEKPGKKAPAEKPGKKDKTPPAEKPGKNAPGAEVVSFLKALAPCECYLVITFNKQNEFIPAGQIVICAEIFVIANDAIIDSLAVTDMSFITVLFNGDQEPVNELPECVKAITNDNTKVYNVRTT